MVPLKYLSKFWKTLEMPLINWEINLILTWSDKCVLSNDAQTIPLAITDIHVSLSTQDNAKLL